MKLKLLTLISLALMNIFSAHAEDAANCNTSALQYTNAQAWEEREICLDPYKTICENDSTNENFIKRGLKFMYEAAVEAGENVYQPTNNY